MTGEVGIFLHFLCVRMDNISFFSEKMEELQLIFLINLHFIFISFWYTYCRIIVKGV